MKASKNLLMVTLVLFVAGCGVQKAAEDTRDLVSASNEVQRKILDGINQTNKSTAEMKASVHLQILTLALQNMLSKQAAIAPTLMLPYAEAYAKEASEEELIQTAYVLLSTFAMPAPPTMSADEIEVRKVSFGAFKALAGLVSDEKFTGILKSQIDNGGRYADTTAVLVAGRSAFLEKRSPCAPLGQNQEAQRGNA